MEYFYIEPEVPGGLGDNSVIDASLRPIRVIELHYEFDGWLGDALLESFPIFLVTESAKRALAAAHVSGVSFDQVEITQSEQYDQLFPDRKLPDFAWLKPEGKAGADDFGIGKDYRLVVSSRVLDILSPMGLSHADIEPLDG